MKIQSSRLAELKVKFKGLRIAVLGDVMLDSYYWGEVRRISPEAPVPVVEVNNESYRFGGAANVAYNIATLTGLPLQMGVVGNDRDATTFKKLMKDAKISSEGLVVDSSRPTTVKTRLMAHNQHVVRFDKENTNPITEEIQSKFIEILNQQIGSLDALILQDYNKGVLTQGFIEQVVEICRQNNVIVTVDPKYHNFFSYKNVTVFKPNRKEAEDMLKMRIRNESEVREAGKILMSKLKAQHVLITLGEDGVAIFSKGKDVKIIPTKARKVADVSGAGDTVIATLTMAMAAGADIYEASILANYAAGIVCEEVGIVPVQVNNLFDTVERSEA
ncbi:MAG: D-glycero-beta-D-manno-heptose-7-phosphate kinase [Ignavibacteria bacterium]|nr:D-glycero-beta-D-manno-heptose-7-phosphate kinase [Ignavibacteria bacterium]